MTDNLQKIIIDNNEFIRKFNVLNNEDRLLIKKDIDWELTNIDLVQILLFHLIKLFQIYFIDIKTKSIGKIYIKLFLKNQVI